MNESEVKSILKKRAEKLARVEKGDENAHDTIEVLNFKLTKENYAIETAYIKEIFPFKNVTPLPGAPNFVFGLLNVRRKIISVIDLKVFFGLPSDDGPGKKVIILSSSEMEYALLSDAVSSVCKIRLADIEPPLPTLTGIRQEFLRGTLTNGTVILDGHKLLTSKQIVVDETS